MICYLVVVLVPAKSLVCFYVRTVFGCIQLFLSMIAEDGSMMYDFVDAVKALQMVMQQQVNHRALT